MNHAETEDDAQSLDEVLETLADGAADGAPGERVLIGEVLDMFGRRAFGPLLLVPALIALLPSGGIPGVPSAMACLVILVAIQMFLPHGHPWLPPVLMRIGFKRASFETGIEKLRPVGRAVSRVTNPRLEILVRPPLIYVVALTCIALAASLFPLDLVPFAGALPAAAIAVLALGLTAHDGIVVAAGLAFAAATAALAIWYFF